MIKRVEEIIKITILVIGITWIFTIFFISEWSSAPYSQLSPDIELNQKFCGSSQCKFLFLYKASEQESKAQKHMNQIAQMAQKLNRTLVLTNVGKSRIGSCLSYPFNYYYSVEYFQKIYPDLKMMTQNQFIAWATLRNKKPSSRQINIRENRNTKFHDLVQDQSNKFKLEKNSCFTEVDFDNIKLYNLNLGGRYWKNSQSLKDLSDYVIDNLKQFDDTEILLIEQSFYYPIFPNNIPHLEYAPHIIDKAFTISQHLQPFIAVQWRMELGNPFNMPKCAEKLVTSLKELKKVYNIENIYFATDYPLKRSLAQSFSFHDIKKNYHGKAIDILRKNVDFYSWLNYTLTDQFGNKMHVDKFALSGIPGILDKIVCSRAKIFLIAPPECRKKTSSFTSMISSERRNLLKANVEGIENISTEW